jgi:hypothetical protein
LSSQRDEGGALSAVSSMCLNPERRTVGMHEAYSLGRVRTTLTNARFVATMVLGGHGIQP